jgi:hypothetical protein
MGTRRPFGPKGAGIGSGLLSADAPPAGRSHRSPHEHQDPHQPQTTLALSDTTIWQASASRRCQPSPIES